MDLSQRWLLKKLAKRSRNSSYLPPDLAWTDAAKDIPPTPTPPFSNIDEGARGITTYPSLSEWRFLTTMNVTMKTTKMEILRDGIYWSKSLYNQTHDLITQDRVGSGELTSMVTVTKKHLHCQINLGSVYKGFSFVK